jgi:hypothetical protein
LKESPISANSSNADKPQHYYPESHERKSMKGRAAIGFMHSIVLMIVLSNIFPPFIVFNYPQRKNLPYIILDSNWQLMIFSSLIKAFDLQKLNMMLSNHSITYVKV